MERTAKRVKKYKNAIVEKSRYKEKKSIERKCSNLILSTK